MQVSANNRSYNAGGKMAVQGVAKAGNGMFKRLSPQEKQYRKVDNLCWKCNELWGLGLVCKLEHLNLIIVDDDVDLENVKWLSGELEMARKSVDVCNIKSWMKCWSVDDEEEEVNSRKLIVIKGYINGEMDKILIDTGTVRSFIDDKLSQRLGLRRKIVKS
ncbi:OLC1v1031688C1 [Oldenlandia corymbosa var. corymbosa]|uniref:OLC1v1031688C1 n=1 Tax=Oldenlandia corymbosa var. corymbosa TaxID=529605 RepID=A0AAV1CJT2_OLDCO|nr:OLC1v1031688C1 [Oldenlandia corymbosa var. corymbosa]